MIETNSNRTNAGIIAKEGYEASVAARALARSGKCPQLKGTVHELMFCDQFNANPLNIISGDRAQLTKSTTATMKDIIITRNGKVTGHAQLKDCVSNGGVSKTARQINSGHYNKTKIYGTKETAEKLAGKTNQTVHSSGVSSDTTSRIANKALGNMPSLSALGTAAKAGGVTGAITSAGIEALSSGYDYLNGDKELDEALEDIGCAAVKGAVTGGASAVIGGVAAGVAGTATSALVATSAGAALAATAGGAAVIAAAPVVAAIAAPVAVFSFVGSLFD